MTHFRIHYEPAGGHVHMKVFAGKSSNMTHGKCGDLCMTMEEFEDFRRWFQRAECEFVKILRIGNPGKGYGDHPTMKIDGEGSG